MSDEASPRLGLPYVAAGQAQKHLTVNEGLGFLDGYIGCAVESRTTTAQPSLPSDGAMYLTAAGATGADWATRPVGALLRYEAGAWSPLTVVVGQFLYVKDENRILIRAVTNEWKGVGNYVTSLSNVGGVAIGAPVDAVNPLLVKAAAALFTALTAGFQVKINKTTTADTASLLYQTGFSGRAEIGLCGDDRLHLKMSADGATWSEAWVVDGAGRTGLGVSSPTSRLHVDGAARVKSYLKAALPSASGEGAGAIIFVSDDSAGATLAFSDGAAWRRVHDRAVVA